MDPALQDTAAVTRDELAVVVRDALAETYARPLVVDVGEQGVAVLGGKPLALARDLRGQIWL